MGGVDGNLCYDPGETTSSDSHQVDTSEGGWSEIYCKGSFVCLSASVSQFNGLMCDVKGTEESRKTHKFLAWATTWIAVLFTETDTLIDAGTWEGHVEVKERTKNSVRYILN